VWRGVIEAGTTDRTISEHAAILTALHAHDPQLAEAAALLHVSTNRALVRQPARDRRDANRFASRDGLGMSIGPFPGRVGV
jgi:GntR family transcriptional repressor for pyruvate dehydrogenase complex